MRGRLTTAVVMVVAAALIGGAGSSAEAQKKKQRKKQSLASILGDYDVKFKEIANNCSQTGMNLRKGTVTLSITSKKKKAQRFTLSIPIAPVMYGADPKKGKFRVKADRAGTAIRGVDGEFSASGRVDDGVIQFVYIAEYFTRGKPLCTQSWNVSGVKAK